MVRLRSLGGLGRLFVALLPWCAVTPLVMAQTSMTIIGTGGPPIAGTPGGLAYYGSDGLLTSTAAVPFNAPVLGGGPGLVPVAGTRSGSTLELGTVSGAHTLNKQLMFDASGNIVASATDIGSGTGGGGDVSSNTSTSVIGELALFSATSGKQIGRATQTGLLKGTAGVLGVAQANVDYVTPAGNVATATALAGNGTNCPAGQAAGGVSALGNAEDCFTPTSGPGLTIQEVDGSPTGTFSVLKVTNGTLTNNGDGSATLITGAGGGGGTPGGATGQFQYNNAGIFGGTTGVLYDSSDTLATSGWKFGSNGVSAKFTNPSVGGDINYRRAIDIVQTTDNSNQNTNFSTNTVMALTRNSEGPGQNTLNGGGKTTYAITGLTSYDRAQGQHFLSTNTMFAYAMGDVYATDYTVNLFGGTNAAGDEGQGIFRLVIDQPGPVSKTTITSLTGQTTCNTTTTQAITKNVTPQAVTVASTTGCAVNDRVVIDAGNFAFSKPHMEIVKITAVDSGAGTITAQFRETHPSGVTVQPSVRLTLASTNNFGTGRYLINYTTPAYTTGTVTSISGTGFVGTGTTWTSTMVGGTALLPGCIALDADDSSDGPFSGANGPLKGWHGIASVTDATHLNVYHAKEAAHPASYKGRGPGTGGYTIRACARVLEIVSNIAYLEPNSFAWTVSDTVVLAHSVDLSVTSLIRAQMSVYNPNAELTSIIGMSNNGTAPITSAIHITQFASPYPAFETILGVFARTAGPMINLAALVDNQEAMTLQTFSTDRKYLRWNTSQSPVLFGVDYATADAHLILYTTGAKFDIHDEINQYVVDLKYRSPILAKRTASGGNPGAGFGSLELVCGTTAGTGKLIMYAGTGTTPVTLADNVGSGLTGC